VGNANAADTVWCQLVYHVLCWLQATCLYQLVCRCMSVNSKTLNLSCRLSLLSTTSMP